MAMTKQRYKNDSIILRTIDELVPKDLFMVFGGDLFNGRRRYLFDLDRADRTGRQPLADRCRPRSPARANAVPGSRKRFRLPARRSVCVWRLRWPRRPKIPTGFREAPRAVPCAERLVRPATTT